VNLNEVTQRRLEIYQERFLELVENVKSAARWNRSVIEAAGEAGIASGLPADLLDLPPRQVKALTERIQAHISKAQEPVSGEA
jgi:hypothetical protein